MLRRASRLTDVAKCGACGSRIEEGEVYWQDSEITQWVLCSYHAEVGDHEVVTDDE
jgi:hypothetical protein